MWSGNLRRKVLDSVGSQNILGMGPICLLRETPYTMLKLEWGDAKVWIDTAETLYTRVISNPEGFPHRRIGYPDGNRLNVAAVCAGYAFELIFKVLVRACGAQPKGVHASSVAYERLDPERRAEVDRIVADHGWESSDEFLVFLDADLCDKDRKYWMRPRPPGDGNAHGTFHISGRRGFDALKKLHWELSALAIKTIEENQDVYEDWPGTSE